MSALKELFDTYGRNARLYPAVLLMIPLFALPGVLNGIEKLSSGIVTGIAGVALLYGLTHWVRALGKRAELRLMKEWGGLPTTRHLLWHDTTLDATSKRRYHNFLRSNGLDMPSAEEERADPARCRERLASAVTWLRTNRRGDGYKILHSENASYGFRRNLYGAKALGVAIASAAIVVSSWPTISLILQQPAPGPILDLLNSVNAETRAGFAVSVASLLAWTFVVTPNWVRAAAEQYAKALLETCDSVGV